MSKPLLSIVIPTYTREQMLVGTLDSIKDQSYLPVEKIEIIISNDCSKDSTSSVVKNYQEQYPHLPITLVDQEKNLGGPGNWKFCQHAAQGEYLFLLSDDDHLHLDFLKEYMKVLESNETYDLVFSGITFCDKEMAELSDKKLTPHVGEHTCLKALYQQLDSHHMVMSTIYRTDLFNKYSGWNPKYGVHIDCSAFCLHALHGKKAYYIDRALFKYRILPDSWASFNPEKQDIQYQNYRKKLDDLMALSKENGITIKDSFHDYYKQHVQSIINALEIKYANSNISSKDLRMILNKLVAIFPEGKDTQQYKKMMLSSWIGLWWLKLIRKVLNKNDPYQSHYKLFEECK